MLSFESELIISDQWITSHYLKFFQTGFVWKVFRPFSSYHLKTFQTRYFIFRYETFSDHLAVTLYNSFKPDLFVDIFQTTDQSPFERLSNGDHWRWQSDRAYQPQMFLVGGWKEWWNIPIIIELSWVRLSWELLNNKALKLGSLNRQVCLSFLRPLFLQ